MGRGRSNGVKGGSSIAGGGAAQQQRTTVAQAAAAANSPAATATALGNQLINSLQTTPYDPNVPRDILNKMPIGTRIYDGSQTMDDRFSMHPTYYQLTNKFSDGSAYWTLWGDTENYTARNSNTIYDTLRRRRSNPQFKIRVEIGN